MANLKMSGSRIGTAPTSRLVQPPKRTDRHYGSVEHRAWREAVKRRAGGVCERCGRQAKLFADHIVELRDGGAPLDLGNGQALCGSCHTSKTATVRQMRNSVAF